MAYLTDNSECCAIKDMTINGSKPEKAIWDILEDSMRSHYQEGKFVKDDSPNLDCSHVVFSQAGARSTYGERLADYIRAEGLGHVAASRMGINPNHGSKVKVFVWTPNHNALLRWWNEHSPNK